MKLSVVIPVYKNISEFETNLKHNLTYIEDCEIIVVNDDPSHNLQKILVDFTHLSLIENKRNLGFAGAVNAGVRKVTSDLVMLLNSDVKLLNDSYKKAFKYFDDGKIFAVSFAQKEKNGEIVGKNRIYWENGFVHHAKALDMETGITAWAEGGSCIFNKKIFDALSGFDEIYTPFYWEDIDLSYRAWKNGYQVLFDRDILVEHYHESTIGAHFQKNQIRSIAYRNQLFFIWKNIGNTLLQQHMFYLQVRIVKSLAQGDFSFVKGFIKALLQVPQIFQKRKRLTHSKLFDHAIFALFS